MNLDILGAYPNSLLPDHTILYHPNTKHQNAQHESKPSNIQLCCNSCKRGKNPLADILSRRPVWLNPDHIVGPDEEFDLEDEEGFAMRVMESKPHLLRDNPLLRELESVGNKD